MKRKIKKIVCFSNKISLIIIYLFSFLPTSCFYVEKKNPDNQKTITTLSVNNNVSELKTDELFNEVQVIKTSMELKNETESEEILNSIESISEKLIKKETKINIQISEQPLVQQKYEQPAELIADFVLINGGTFIMGSPIDENGRMYEEGPQHSVTVSSFYIGKYEVTQKEWSNVMGNNPSDFKADNLPVEKISWFDAIEYCNKRSEREGLSSAYTINGRTVTWNKNVDGYRLPTEAEWEYACRAGTITPFNTGENITTNQANFRNADHQENSQTTAVVGSYKPNYWGLFDMHGNVWEWCWDWYGIYSSNIQTDPSGPFSGEGRVIRGGAWNYDSRYIRSASRLNYGASARTNFVGFRIVHR